MGSNFNQMLKPLALSILGLSLKLRVTGLKSAASSGYNVPADGIDIVSRGSAVGHGIDKIIHVRMDLIAGEIGEFARWRYS